MPTLTGGPSRQALVIRRRTRLNSCPWHGDLPRRRADVQNYCIRNAACTTVLQVRQRTQRTHIPDARGVDSRPGPLPLLCLVLSITLSAAAVASESPGQISVTDITHSVLSSLPISPRQTARAIANVDLTRPFQTRTQWTFVAAILPGSHFDGASAQPIDGGPLVQCFVDESVPHFTYATPKNGADSYFGPIELYSARVVFAGAANTRPLLLIKTGSAHGGDGGHFIYTELFSYDRQANEFRSVFSNATLSNNNQETRFIEQGPLRGAVVVADPTSSAPFGYWISVYVRTMKDKRYGRILRYRSATRYEDGNRLAVIDSEMPGILRHMGLWKPGYPLPAPAGCDRPVLRDGEEWCD